MDISSITSVTNIDYIPEQLDSQTSFLTLLKVIKEEMQIAKECSALYPQIESYQDFLAIQTELESYLDARGYGTHFSKIIKTIDVNSYGICEKTHPGAETLVSSYLLSLFVNPGIFHGERFINESLLKNPI